MTAALCPLVKSWEEQTPFPMYRYPRLSAKNYSLNCKCALFKLSSVLVTTYMYSAINQANLMKVLQFKS